MSKIRTGHYLNVVKFDELIVICKSYDLIYKPSKTSYSITALELLSAEVKDILLNVSQKEIAYAKDTNDRELQFVDLKRLSTRVLLAAKSSGVTSVHFNDLVNVNRKIQGRRAVAITAEEKVTMKSQILNKSADPNLPLLKKNSVSQLSYDRLFNNFSKLVEVLKATPEFKPNEEELKITSLSAKLELMRLSNQIVSESTVNLSKVRFDRNQIMYLQENNLVDTAMAVKNYSKSVFGARSIQNKQLSGMRFTKLRN
ncbi:MAG: hypothetical protein ACOYMA_22245 [Bacteroidia bacterium]